MISFNTGEVNNGDMVIKMGVNKKLTSQASGAN